MKSAGITKENAENAAREAGLGRGPMPCPKRKNTRRHFQIRMRYRKRHSTWPA